ncbi:type I restriction modification DNA specificity protein [Flavobacteriaceae bacterium MAR_2010_72]|nr:type I restriction modification DNA specificity protein [Flavobacteriaceae bacterium MAR_2010_72]
MGTWNTTNLSEIEFQRIEAEFYQKKFINAKIIAGDKSFKTYGIQVIHPAEVKRIYSKTGELQIVLAQNVRDNVMDWTGSRFMDKSMLHLIARNKLEEGDVLVTRSGANYGQTSVITIEPKQGDLFACADVLILKSGNIGGPLLSTFLNTTVGKLLMVRGVYGAGQPHVAPSYISHIPFPEFLLSAKDEINNIIYKSRRLQQESQALYQQATTLLEKELGLDKITFDNPKSYTTSFSEVVIGARVDADYFQPIYSQLLSKLSKFELRTINYLSDKLETGVYSSSYSNQGVDYIRGTNISTNGTIIREDLLKTNVVVPNIHNTAIMDDILVTRVGSIGVCGIVLSENQSIYSDNLIRIRIRETNKSLISAKYILLFLQSRYGQMLMTKFSGGSVQQRLNQSMLSKIPIPVISHSKQIEIEELYVESIKTSAKSKQLLNQAKNRVEELIEEAAKNN